MPDGRQGSGLSGQDGLAESHLGALLSAFAQLAEGADFLSAERRDALRAALAAIDAGALEASAQDVDTGRWRTPLARAEAALSAAAERLAAGASEASGVPIDITGYLASEAKNRVIRGVLEAADDAALLAYFEERKAHGELDADVLLTCARLGASRVFFAAIAAAVDLKLDVEMVSAFVEDGGLVLLERLLLRADISETAREAILEAYREAEAGRAEQP